MKREEKNKKAPSFSFSEKGSFFAAIFIACVAAYFMPVNMIWYRISSALSILVLIVVAAAVAGGMFFKEGDEL